MKIVASLQTITKLIAMFIFQLNQRGSNRVFVTITLPFNMRRFLTVPLTNFLQIEHFHIAKCNHIRIILCKSPKSLFINLLLNSFLYVMILNLFKLFPKRLPFQTRKVLTVPLTNFLHIGHFLMAGAQSSQQTRCPQGRKAMDTFFSMQILHRI